MKGGDYVAKTGTREKDMVIKTVDDESFHFQGYASTYGNSDLDGDIIIKGAFDESIKNKSVVPMCFNHSRDKVIGKLELSSDEKGVIAKGTFNLADPLAKNIYDLLKMDALNSMSVGMYVDEFEPIEKERPFGAWNIKKAKIAETSIVTVPANEEAKISAVKSLNNSERHELEALRLEKKRQKALEKINALEAKINV